MEATMAKKIFVWKAPFCFSFKVREVAAQL